MKHSSIHLLLIFLFALNANLAFTQNSGASQTDSYFILLANKRVAVVANPTSVIGKTHLVDTLLSSGIQVVKIFAPEHGFRGEAGNGDHVSNGFDKKTKLPIFSLYGSHTRPTAEMLSNVDVIVFDIQDVGVRFYTFLATMQEVMEAAVISKKSVIILDRPNPNGYYIDGPVMKDKKLYSFVGQLPIPIVHGCTLGELARMINGEGWLTAGKACELTVIPCSDYTHNSYFELPIKPSPNLPNITSIYAYPSLCLFEGTCISIGRGTNLPFQQFGFPNCKVGETSFTPKEIPGVSTNPPFENQLCKGIKVSFEERPTQLNLSWLMTMYSSYPNKEKFFSSPGFFDKLAGNTLLRKQVVSGASEDEIRASWQKDLDAYKIIRKKYLLYSDFN
ncbi:MAG: exo-beta-N-acetylmuramidase NamZ domain-containing protein [Sediminibacterium sp.]